MFTVRDNHSSDVIYLVLTYYLLTIYFSAIGDMVNGYSFHGYTKVWISCIAGTITLTNIIHYNVKLNINLIMFVYKTSISESYIYCGSWTNMNHKSANNYNVIFNIQLSQL